MSLKECLPVPLQLFATVIMQIRKHKDDCFLFF